MVIIIITISTLLFPLHVVGGDTTRWRVKPGWGGGGAVLARLAALPRLLALDVSGGETSIYRWR